MASVRDRAPLPAVAVAPRPTSSRSSGRAGPIPVIRSLSDESGHVS